MLENTGNALVAMLPENPEGLLQQLRQAEARGRGEPAEPPIRSARRRRAAGSAAARLIRFRSQRRGCRDNFDAAIGVEPAADLT